MSRKGEYGIPGNDWSETVHRAGFVTLLGLPNVGKSSLLNRILGNRVSIVTEKPQTTRRIVKGILNHSEYQIVFLDTPGFHEPRDVLGKSLVTSTRQSLYSTDIVLYLTAPDVQEEEPSVILYPDLLKRVPVLLVPNKVDTLRLETRSSFISRVANTVSFEGIYPVSAVTGEGVAELLLEIVSRLPEHPPYYHADFYTDLTERDICAELIRESAWAHCYQEIPYGTEIRIEEFREKAGKTYIRALVYVEREAHKKIVIGRNGSMIKRIGAQARATIENLLGQSVYLDLWVKVEKNWRKRIEILRKWGYQTP